MGAFSTHQSNMAAKIVALVVVALALANAAPRDMSKLDNQVLEDKINEILSSSELMQSAEAQETPDWMVAARRSNTTTVFTQTLSFSFAASAYTGTTKTGVEGGYATHIGIYSGGAYISGSSLTSSAARRAATVTMSVTTQNGDAQSTANNINSNLAALNAAINAAGASVCCTGASTTTTISTSGAAQLTFGFAAILAALFAHLF